MFHMLNIYICLNAPSTLRFLIEWIRVSTYNLETEVDRGKVVEKFPTEMYHEEVAA